MTRHRRFLLGLGLVQILLAIGLVAHHVGRIEDVRGRRTPEVTGAILQELEAHGIDLPEESAADSFDPYYAFGWRIESALFDAEHSIAAPIVALGALGLLALVAGCIPERRCAVPPAGG